MFLPGSLDCADEELGAVGVWSGVGHRQNPGPGVLQDKVLVFKLVAVDGLPTGSVVVGEVTSLRAEQAKTSTQPVLRHFQTGSS